MYKTALTFAGLAMIASAAQSGERLIGGIAPSRSQDERGYGHDHRHHHRYGHCPEYGHDRDGDRDGRDRRYERHGYRRHND